MRDLLEREAELAAIEDALRSAADGTGCTVIVEGAAGIGKTRLLDAAYERAETAGMRVLSARGGEFERAFPFGVVRQLFEGFLHAMPDPDRDAILTGAAARAGGLLVDGDAAPAGPGADEGFAIQHGLYWLVANLAAAEPLVIVVDDAHWADAPSLRWLAYLGRRVGELPVLVLMASRPAAPDTDVALLASIAAEPGVRFVRPGLLGADAAGRLLEAELGVEPAPEFRTACLEATGGNPFMLGELARELAADGVAPAAAAAPRVAELSPQAVSRAVLLRLGRLPAPAFDVTRGLAILGERAELRRVAALEELDEDAAGAAADALASAGILAPGRPLSFAHPIVRTAIYAELKPSARAHGHARAAQILHEEGARADEVASHLLETEPDGDRWVLDRLLDAARRAVAQGATEGARPYLRRALGQELSRAERARLLLELGAVEARLSSPAVVEVLEEALELADDPETRGLASFELGRALVLSLRLRDGIEVMERGIAPCLPTHPELARRLRAELIGVSRLDDSLREFVHTHLPVLESELDECGEVRGLVLANLAWEAMLRNDPADECARLALEALDGGGLLASEGSDSPMFMLAMGVLLYTDRWEEYDRHLQEAIDASRKRGSALGFAFGNCLRAYLGTRTGDLADAVEGAQAALDAMTDVGWLVVLLIAAYYLADARLQQGDAAAAEQVVTDRGFGSAIPPYTPFNVLREVRGRIQHARGNSRAGLEDVLETGRRQEASGVITPAIIPWRAHAASLHAALGEHDSARHLAAENLELARAFGAPSVLGHALRVAGGVAPARDGLPLLREAVAVLAESGAQLEHARAQADLGSALRRADQRSEAVDLLRAALETASRCGAAGLEDRVRDELRAAGVRPRRTALSGVDSLTPSERRVAEFVAKGLGNAEIAQALFVTRRTVEYHLTHAYRKLGVSSREELAAELGGAAVAR